MIASNTFFLSKQFMSCLKTFPSLHTVQLSIVFITEAISDSTHVTPFHSLIRRHLATYLPQNQSLKTSVLNSFLCLNFRSTARLVDQIRLFKQMRYAFQTDDEVKERLKQRIQECKNENLHALASENSSNFHLSSSHGSRKFHDAFRKMKATFGGHNQRCVRLGHVTLA